MCVLKKFWITREKYAPPPLKKIGCAQLNCVRVSELPYDKKRNSAPKGARQKQPQTARLEASLARSETPRLTLYLE